MKILLGALSFADFTGSELHNYHIGRSLVRRGHDVSVVARHLGAPLTTLAERAGLKVFDCEAIERISPQFDIMNLAHIPIVMQMLSLYPGVPLVANILSEIHKVEEPVIHPSVRMYVTVRKKTARLLMKKWGIARERIWTLYSGVDSGQFKSDDCVSYEHRSVIGPFKKRIVLFAGTVDWLRKSTILDIIANMPDDRRLLVVGKKREDYLDHYDPNRVEVLNQTQHVDHLCKFCDETATILLSRAALEGWMCGKPGWIYNIDALGQIIGKHYFHPPKDIYKCELEYVTSQLVRLYEAVLGGGRLPLDSGAE